ncbi:MAG: hypothetical protein UHH87_11355 [Akkermansia sp.]|nr:hypothetical protein [Akkermansia sp.]
METTHNYNHWFAPMSEITPVSSRASHSAASVQAGEVIASGSGNRNQSPPTHALQDKVSIPISVPSGVDAEGNPRPILARISATFRVEDWGFVTVDGKRILDMTSSRESAGIYGGHPTWPAETASAVVASGEHELEFHYENIEMADASNNKLVCEYSYRVVALEDGGVKDEESCGCGGSSCSMDGGVHGARSGAASSASSSAGSEVSATVTEDSLFWSCNVGTLRGMGTSLGGKVVLQAKELSAHWHLRRLCCSTTLWRRAWCCRRAVCSPAAGWRCSVATVWWRCGIIPMVRLPRWVWIQRDWGWLHCCLRRDQFRHLCAGRSLREQPGVFRWPMVRCFPTPARRVCSLRMFRRIWR